MDQDIVESPCTGVCSLDDQGLCRGCRRTGSEIAAWPALSNSAQRELLERLKDRDAS